MDNIKMWTGLSVEASLRMTKDRDKWRKYIHGVANPRIEDGKKQKQNKNNNWFLVTESLPVASSVTVRSL